MSCPTTNLHTGDRHSESYKNYEWNGTAWEENEICIPDHHWKFNEVSTATYASDSGSLPTELRKNGTATFGATGKITDSLSLPAGAYNYVTSYSAPAATLYGVTVSVWVKLINASRNSALYTRYPSGTGLYFLLRSDHRLQLRFNTVTYITT